jgi:hypothetical protein
MENRQPMDKITREQLLYMMDEKRIKKEEQVLLQRYNSASWLGKLIMHRRNARLRDVLEYERVREHNRKPGIVWPEDSPDYDPDLDTLMK